MKKYLREIFSYLLIGSAIVVFLDWLFAISYSQCSVMMQEMYQWPENIDTLFMGSSHTYLSYDPKLVDELLDVESFNAGTSSQGLVTTYYLLKEVEKYHKISTVYLDTFFGVYVHDISPDVLSLYQVSDCMKDLDDKLEYLWTVGGVRGIENGIIYRYSRRADNADIMERMCSKQLSVPDYSELISDTSEYKGKGFVWNYKTIDKEMDFQKEAREFDLTENIPISDDSYEYLIQIIEHCEENNIDLVLVDQPMPNEFLSEVNGYDNYVSFLSKLAEEYGIDYMNFNLYKGYEKTLDDFYDFQHLNGPGAEKYTRIFCDTVNDLKYHEKTMNDLFCREYSQAVDK